MLKIEAGILIIALLIAWVYPTLCSTWFVKAERRFCALAKRCTLSVLLVAVLALALRLAVLPVEPIPEPIVHDEFGYLLAADTFAHGRLTNPTPPMWEHFETFSILMKPTYQCFAQPAQGMMLAFGKVIFGHPFWGVWMSCGLMCALITWMLQGWLDPGWALLGGLFAVLRFGVFGYWADSYWGGAVGAIGGALVLGALPRIKARHKIRDALLMGLGLIILANSRPFEGFVISLAVALLLFAWIVSRTGPSLRTTCSRIVLPLTVVLALGATATMYYFSRVTGSPLRMPYQVERHTYGVAPYMVWQHMLPEPVYHDEVVREMYTREEVSAYKFSRTPAGVILKVYLAWNFFFGPALMLPFITVIFALPADFSIKRLSNGTRSLLILLLAAGFALVTETFYSPHYSAPATALFVALTVLCMRKLRSRPFGTFLTRAIPVICVLSFVLRIAAVPLHIPLSRLHVFAWHQNGPAKVGREELLRTLQRLPGKQLVVVRYAPDHNHFSEWVYNEANIDASKVVWARDLGDKRNRRLLNYFNDRHVYLLYADDKPVRITEYDELPVSMSVSDAGSAETVK